MTPWTRTLLAEALTAEADAAHWDEGCTNNVRHARYAEGLRRGLEVLRSAEMTGAAELNQAHDLLTEATTIIGSVCLVLGQLEAKAGGDKVDAATARAYADAVARLRSIEGLTE